MESLVFIDATFGAGGHSCAILKSAMCKVFAVDRDPMAIEIAQVLSTRPEYKARLVPIHGKFSQLLELAKYNQIDEETIHGVLLDVGPSSMQFDDPSRGFSVNKDGPLDMRMDGQTSCSNKRSATFTAADVVNTIGEQELVSVLRNYGGEKDAGRITRAIIKAREKEEIITTKQLATVVSNAVGFGRKDKLNRFAHPATKTFQALRILVNDELNELQKALKAAQKLLVPGGRLVVISFHSVEDIIVKHFLKDPPVESISRRKAQLSPKNSAWLPLNKKVVCPSDQELLCNPRCRSAKLRAAVKTNNTVLSLNQLTHILDEVAKGTVKEGPTH
ncbi:putative methyltransferase-like protein 15 [Exaiptasia diaphana]|nr:putative methyltransferase-like protein 15 [Exaiptasia diaphana]